MKVRQLIDVLQALPDDLPVAWTETIDGQGGSYAQIKTVSGIVVVDRSDIPTYARERGRVVILKSR